MSWGRQGHLVVSKTIEIELPWTYLAASTKKQVFIPSTGWSLLGDYRLVRGWGERVGSTGPIHIAPAIQLAPDPRNPEEGLESVHFWEEDGIFESPEGWRVLDDPDFKTPYVRSGWLVRLPENGDHQHVAATGAIELSAK